MTESENKATYSSNFYWHDPTNFLFVKYQAKEKKSVCLLSSMHDSADVDTSNEKKKPEMILFYNTNKVGDDCFDQMHAYTLQGHQVEDGRSCLGQHLGHCCY